MFPVLKEDDGMYTITPPPPLFVEHLGWQIQDKLMAGVSSLDMRMEAQ